MSFLNNASFQINKTVVLSGPVTSTSGTIQVNGNLDIQGNLNGTFSNGDVETLIIGSSDIPPNVLIPNLFAPRATNDLATTTLTINGLPGSYATNEEALAAGLSVGASYYYDDEVSGSTVIRLVAPPRYFAIGNLSAVIGQQVTFWSAQWSAQNSLSGGSAPVAFKGYANNVNTTSKTFTTLTGNSVKPPSVLPVNPNLTVMLVNSVTQSGTTINGTYTGLGLVSPNPGYNPAPGGTGTGTYLGPVVTGSVLNTNTSVTYPTLSAAVAAATAGNILHVFGTVVSSLTALVDKNLTIIGIGGAILDGNNVLTPIGLIQVVTGVTATVNNLTIQNVITGTFTGAIYNQGTLTLDGVTVTKCNKGITNEGGILTMNNSSVNNNGNNGGIVNDVGNNPGELIINNSIVSNNVGDDIFAGGITNNTGFAEGACILIMTNSVVDGNSSPLSGGIYNQIGSIVTMTGCIITNNTSTSQQGGGIYSVNNDSIVTLIDSTISNNTTPSDGGGIGNFFNSTVNLNGSSSVINNTANRGGGIYNFNATVNLNGSPTTITGNTAIISGGGIYNNGGTLNGNTTGVTANSPDDIVL